MKSLANVKMIHAKYFYLKRFLDIFFSLMILLLVSPVILIVSLCIILDDGFPVIFRQVRVGKRGKTFTMWKFRSMPVIQKPKANEADEYATWVNGVPDSFVFKSSYPPNVRPLGKFLRKYSLDELPQLWNVIKGEMSLIGPRPEVPKIAQYYNHIQQDRLMVKPGITGYAQVKGRSNINHGEKMMLDRYYVENVSLLLDLKIICLTVLRVVFPKDSY